MKSLIEIKPILNSSPKSIAITMHQRPDADAMGASLAMFDYLRQKGHEVNVISPTVFPDFLKWMPGCDHVIVFETQKAKALEVLEHIDILFCLDFNSLGRTKDLAPYLEKTSCIKVLLDHHLEPQQIFDYGKSDISAASTALLVYEFIVSMDDEKLINNNIAQCVYAGTMTDTGSFRFTSTSYRVHLMVAKLMEKGLEHEPIHQAIYDNYLESRLRFIGHALLNRLEVFYEYNVAMIAIPYSDIQRFGLKTGDTEGLVNFPLSIKGIKMAALIIDRKEEVRMSFRSKGEFDVNAFARKYFEGGGHQNAAGGRSADTLEKTVERFKNALKENEAILK
ncbi:MAG: bifunctional oligoribonuclease/PAP phosphatase NrnA [Chitinophagaceae bacterium]|jgi:phosphoesterase RecJ-like protein|nr:MAG: bifunctional oligoribonuclease/PAP phosphatase NrnA [Chitinophagaceae bacterium]